MSKRALKRAQRYVQPHLVGEEALLGFTVGTMNSNRVDVLAYETVLYLVTYPSASVRRYKYEHFASAQWRPRSLYDRHTRGVLLLELNDGGHIMISFEGSGHRVPPLIVDLVNSAKLEPPPGT